MVQDDPKLLDDSGELPKPNKMIGGLIPGREIISLLDRTNHVVKRLMCPLPPQRKRKEKNRKESVRE
jgi:hypothetical protein